MQAQSFHNLHPANNPLLGITRMVNSPSHHGGTTTTEEDSDPVSLEELGESEESEEFHELVEFEEVETEAREDPWNLEEEADDLRLAMRQQAMRIQNTTGIIRNTGKNPTSLYHFPSDSTARIREVKQISNVGPRIQEFRGRVAVSCLLAKVATSAPGRSLMSMAEQLLEEAAGVLEKGGLRNARYTVRISLFLNTSENQRSCISEVFLMLSCALRSGHSGAKAPEVMHVWCTVTRLNLEMGAARVSRELLSSEAKVTSGESCVPRPLRRLAARRTVGDAPEEMLDIVWEGSGRL